MGHILHGSARTTPQTRRELQNSKKSVKELALKYNITENTVRKWQSRDTVEDLSHRPKNLQQDPWNWLISPLFDYKTQLFF